MNVLLQLTLPKQLNGRGFVNVVRQWCAHGTKYYTCLAYLSRVKLPIAESGLTVFYLHFDEYI